MLAIRLGCLHHSADTFTKFSDELCIMLLYSGNSSPTYCSRKTFLVANQRGNYLLVEINADGQQLCSE